MQRKLTIEIIEVPDLDNPGPAANDTSPVWLETTINTAAYDMQPTRCTVPELKELLATIEPS